MGSCSKDRHPTACWFLFLKPPGPVIGWEFPAWKKISKTTRYTPGKWSELAMENRGKIVSLFASAAGDLPFFFYVRGFPIASVVPLPEGSCCFLFRSLITFIMSLPWWGWVKPHYASLWLRLASSGNTNNGSWLLNNHDIHPGQIVETRWNTRKTHPPLLKK